MSVQESGEKCFLSTNTSLVPFEIVLEDDYIHDYQEFLDYVSK